METENANSATILLPSQLQAHEEVHIASSRLGSPPVDQMTSSPVDQMTSSRPAHLGPISSPQSPCPSRPLIRADKRKYFDQYVPLYKLAVEGKWNAAKAMIDADNALLKAAITEDKCTLLHIAAGTNHVHFVEELVKLLDPNDMELRNTNGNTALCYAAAATGNVKIADTLVKKNGCLPQMRGAEGMTPLYVAVLYGRSDMARYLYSQSADVLEEEERNAVFFHCIQNDLYDLALQMLQKDSALALVRNCSNDTGLHVLARKPSGFSCRAQNQFMNASMQPTPFLQLVGSLWGVLLNLVGSTETLRIIINQPSQITFDATEIGNFPFVAELIRSDPDLIWEMDGKNRSIIHIAVLHRHSSIFSLIHELGSFKYFMVDLEDDEGNNILHYAAKLAPPHMLNSISGAALRMTHELLWFEEVKKLMLPSEIEKKNSSGKTPGEIFVEEHKDLLTKAESWTKSTANNCMLISTLISTGVLTATFCLPGGINKNTGTPSYLQKPAFLLFAVSDAAALISSSASILIFLSILTSSYADYEYFKSLPFKLLFGLIAQIISITSMMVAFSVAFFITYYHGSMWVSHFVSVLTFLPIPLCTFLIFPLWSDIIHSSCFCMSLFWPRKQILN